MLSTMNNHVQGIANRPLEIKEHFDLLLVPQLLAYKMGNVPLPHLQGEWELITIGQALIYSIEMLFRKTYGEITNPAFRSGLGLQKKL